MDKTFTPIVVQAEQRSRDWFEARLGNVTGSRVERALEFYKPTKGHVDAADEYYDLNIASFDIEMLQKLRKDYPTEYVLRANVELVETSRRKLLRHGIVSERLTGMSMDEDLYRTRAMMWGAEQERYAKQRYSLRYGHKVEESPLFLHPEMMAGASPDGLVIDINTGELGVLECKSLEPWNHLYKIVVPEEPPKEYLPQIFMQMWITGRDWCDFVGFDPRQKKETLVLFAKRIERDNFYIDEVLVPGIKRFLEGCDSDQRKFYAIAKRREQMAKNAYWGMVEDVES